MKCCIVQHFIWIFTCLPKWPFCGFQSWIILQLVPSTSVHTRVYYRFDLYPSVCVSSEIWIPRWLNNYWRWLGETWYVNRWKCADYASLFFALHDNCGYYGKGNSQNVVKKHGSWYNLNTIQRSIWNLVCEQVAKGAQW